MAEIIYIYDKNIVQNDISSNIRWLEIEKDYDVYNQHIELCGQKSMSKTTWNDIYCYGTIYCGLFIDEIMVARACVEKYSDDCWEVADVRVVQEYRNKGYAKAVCQYVLSFILENQKKPTIRTEENNYTMQRVIASLGFIKL